MSSRHLVDPELIPMLDSFPQMTFGPETLADARAMMAGIIDAFPTPDVPVDMERRLVPGPDGAPEVPVHLYRPRGLAGPLPALLHIHGGGYVGGTPTMTDAQNRVMANALGCVIASVDYRYAPETAYPGPVEDCYAALRWLYGEAATLDVDNNRIAIGGESAGGGLTAALALLARDRGEVPLILQVLVYPMLDDRTGSVGEAHPNAGEFMWNVPSNIFGWTSHLGHAPGGTGVPAYAAPARANDLSGLPPAFIAVGQLDLFIDENVDYARRLMHAGVSTELHVYPGAFHGFDMVADSINGRSFQAARLAALARAFQIASH